MDRPVAFELLSSLGTSRELYCVLTSKHIIITIITMIRITATIGSEVAFSSCGFGQNVARIYRALRQRPGGGAAGGPSGEDAPAQKAPLERAVAMHAAAAKARGFAGGV
jgi:hypothetical protein